MKNCFICRKGQLVKTSSRNGEEVYCNSCRRVIVSTVLNFKFAEVEPDPCKTEDGLPGFKGPGEKAVCHPYTDDASKEEAKIKARESEYAFEHRRAASKIVNALSYFTGLPSSITGAQTSSQDFSGQPALAPDNPIDGATTTDDNGVNVQMGDLNKSNPLNSGTTASKRLADLFKEEMGNPLCTEHNCRESECKQAHESH